MLLSILFSRRYVGSTAIGPFQNRITKKKIETKRLKIPNVKSVELKDIKIKVKEKIKTIPRRISSRVNKSNFLDSLLSLTHHL